MQPARTSRFFVARVIGLPPEERMNASSSLSSSRRAFRSGSGTAGTPRGALIAFEYLIIAFIIHFQISDRKLQGLFQIHARQPIFAQQSLFPAKDVPMEGVTRYNGGGCCSMDSFLKLLFG